MNESVEELSTPEKSMIWNRFDEMVQKGDFAGVNSSLTDSNTLESKIAQFCSAPFQIMLHNNKTTFLRIEKKGKEFRFHLHRLFLEAPASLLEAVVRFAHKNDPKAKAIIQQMVQLHFSTHRAAPQSLVLQGKVYDLGSIYARVKTHYFSDDYDAAIGWSKGHAQGKFRSITFGCYDRHRHQIRMNPILDHEGVPLFFLEFVVYHEMLHAVCEPFIDEQGRTWVHTREFKEREKLHHFFASARAWEKKSLTLLKRMSYGRS